MSVEKDHMQELKSVKKKGIWKLEYRLDKEFHELIDMKW